MLTRRRVLAPLLALAAAAGVGRAIAAVRGLVVPARPLASGTSATRCAQCGASDHTMLDRRCPLAPRVI